jgi:vacuolar-type H+-ATPase subunit I/STV1
MQDSILFDNIIVSQDVNSVEKFTEETYNLKADIEKKNAIPDPDDLTSEGKDNEKSGFSDRLREFFRIAFVERNFLKAIQEEKVAAASIGTVIALWFLFIFRYVLSTDDTPNVDVEELKAKLAEREKKLKEMEDNNEKKEEAKVVKSTEENVEEEKQAKEDDEEAEDKVKQRKPFQQSDDDVEN